MPASKTVWQPCSGMQKGDAFINADLLAEHLYLGPDVNRCADLRSVAGDVLELYAAFDAVCLDVLENVFDGRRRDIEHDRRVAGQNVQAHSPGLAQG